MVDEENCRNMMSRATKPLQKPGEPPTRYVCLFERLYMLQLFQDFHLYAVVYVAIRQISEVPIRNWFDDASVVKVLYGLKMAKVLPGKNGRKSKGRKDSVLTVELGMSFEVLGKARDGTTERCEENR